jgi:hypothetical protein
VTSLVKAISGNRTRRLNIPDTEVRHWTRPWACSVQVGASENVFQRLFWYWPLCHTPCSLWQISKTFHHQNSVSILCIPHPDNVPSTLQPAPT